MIDNWSPSARLRQLCQHQRDRWQRGEKTRVEWYIEQHAELRSDEALLLDFIYAEYALREEHGDAPQVADYIQRFPELAPQLQVLFEVSQAIDSDSSLATCADETPFRVPARSRSNEVRLDTTSTRAANDGAPFSVPAMRRPGTPFGPYELIEEIARGGMGIVYKARQPKLDRIVALKMIVPSHFDSESAKRRFQIEAEAAARLDHPGVVPIHDVGEHEGQHYLCMAFIDGESLADRLSRGPLPPDEAARIVRDVADAVQHAHERGIIHRDLKPANILIDTTGRPRVTDFGLARKDNVAGALTIDGSIIGTPAYMSPEQALGNIAGISPASDVYSLGAVLFHLLTGKPPFADSTFVAIIRHVCEVAPEPLREIDASIPEALEGICLKCLAKAPQDRYPSAAALGDELSRFLKHEALATSLTRRDSAFPTWARRPVVLGIIAAAVLILMGAGIWSFSLPPRSSGSHHRADVVKPTTYAESTKSIAGENQSPLSGEITVRIWDPRKNSPRHGLAFDSPGALPLRYGDAIRIEARTNRPAYLYLIWIGPDGEAIPVYPWKPTTPWKPEYWAARPKTESPTDSVSLPEEADSGWPIEKGAGLETIVLLGRDEPLPETLPIKDLLSGLPSQQSRYTQAFVWLEPSERTSRSDRAPNFSNPQKIDDPTLKLKNLLDERLKPHFPLLRAVCLSNRGS